MKNALLKFAGLFVEKIPVDERDPSAAGTPTGESARRPALPDTKAPAQASAQQPGGPAGAPGAPGSAPAALHGHFPTPSGYVAVPQPGGPGGGAGGRPSAAPAIAIALRAWVPQEYAGYLAPFGLHVVAAGGELTVEQARTWGANVLVVSAECLGSHTHLLVHPQLPTVFVTPEPMTLPEATGVIQVQEPLRASEVAAAAREALASWSGAVG